MTGPLARTLPSQEEDLQEDQVPLVKVEEAGALWEAEDLQVDPHPQAAAGVIQGVEADEAESIVPPVNSTDTKQGTPSARDRRTNCVSSAIQPRIIRRTASYDGEHPLVSGA